MTIALALAPTPVEMPDEMISKSGAASYSSPLSITSTETSLPPVIIGFNSHLSPFFTVTVGVFSKLVLDWRELTKLKSTYTVIDPLTIGVAVIIPTVPAAVAVC